MSFVTVAILLQALPPPTLPPTLPAAPPRQPAQHWTVDRSDNACLLTREYGTPDATAAIGFNAQPLGQSVQVILLTPGSAAASRFDHALLVLEPSGRSFDGLLVSYALKEREQTLGTLSVDADIAEELRATSHVAVERKGAPRLRFAVPGIGKAFAALRTCQDDLLRGWGVDPGERDRVRTEAHGANPAAWVRSADYPAAALRAHVQGVSSILWAVGLDGRVAACRVVKSSGTAALDQAACSTIARRGRYTPALGLDGKPMVTHFMRNVVWRLP